jgi:hypothetical protein
MYSMSRVVTKFKFAKAGCDAFGDLMCSYGCDTMLRPMGVLSHDAISSCDIRSFKQDNANAVVLAVQPLFLNHSAVH